MRMQIFEKFGKIGHIDNIYLKKFILLNSHWYKA